MKKEFMQEAIRLATESVRSGQGGPFGAVVVKGGKIIGRGSNRVTTSNDPTSHAEVVAIRDACRNLNDFQLTGCEIYSSCEPCPMCLGAIYWARPDRLYYACTHSDAAAIGFDDSFIYEELALPPEKRKIRTVQFMRDEGLVSFREWTEKTDKVLY